MKAYSSPNFPPEVHDQYLSLASVPHVSSTASAEALPPARSLHHLYRSNCKLPRLILGGVINVNSVQYPSFSNWPPKDQFCSVLRD